MSVTEQTPRAETAPRTLQSARAEFIRSMNRDTTKTDGPRLLAVLDALIAWSQAHPNQLRFRASETKSGALSFERVDSNEIFWTAQTARGASPRLALIPRAGRMLTDEERAHAIATLNTYSREALASDAKLHIGFGALKNAEARAAVLALLDELLARPT